MNTYILHHLHPRYWYAIIIVNNFARLRIEEQSASGQCAEVFDGEFANQETLDAILLAHKNGREVEG